VSFEQRMATGARWITVQDGEFYETLSGNIHLDRCRVRLPPPPPLSPLRLSRYPVVSRVLCVRYPPPPSPRLILFAVHFSQYDDIPRGGDGW
jgi:hypothetical protein